MGIALQNVTLTYDLLYDRGRTLKETLLNAIHSRSYVKKKRDKLSALNDVNLKIEHGERLGIIGHNGAGKSSLLKVISGILKPSSGMVKVTGSVQPLIEMAAGFNPEFSGRENIYLNGYMLGFKRNQIAANEAAIIEFAELGEFIDVPIKYYSSGMQVRLAFTIATSIDPEYLIFDELLSAGDAAFFIKARKRLDDLIQKAKILVVVSHDLDTISTFCNRVIVLDKGKITFDGLPKEAIKFYLNHSTANAKPNSDTPLDISQVKLSWTSNFETRVACELTPSVAVEGRALLRVGAKSDAQTAVQTFSAKAHEPFEVTFHVRTKNNLVGDIPGQIEFFYSTLGGVELYDERKLILSYGELSSSAFEIWS